MRGRYVISLVLLAACAGVLAGCGGGSSDSTDSGSTAANSTELSKSEWIAQADEICQGYADETKELRAEFESLEVSEQSSPEELSEAAAAFREIIPKSEEEVGHLRELEPPSEDDGTIDRMLSTVEDKQTTLAKIPDALEEGEFSEVGSLVEEADKENGAAEGMAKRYGLKVCGSEE